MAGVLKKTTGLTGLAVLKKPHHDLLYVYGKLQRVLAALPNDYTYRQVTEKLVNERVEIVKQTESIPQIEEKIGCGQVEEILIQAKNELALAENILAWKSWEKLIEQPPPNQWVWPPTK